MRSTSRFSSTPTIGWPTRSVGSCLTRAITQKLVSSCSRRDTSKWGDPRPILRSASLVALLFVPQLAAAPVAIAQGGDRAWMIGPFEKPTGVNPILTPNKSATFRPRPEDQPVHWEETATFNPAAVVRNGSVYVLYRAEDATGEQKIGYHTSRIGLAESADGLRFTRRPSPVLYAQNDAQAANESPGGVEDPRIVETEDGRYVMTYTQWNRQVPR